mgnify:CR=1 FL=1
MSVSIQEIEKFVGKDAIIHLVQEDGTLKELTVKVEAATVAGVAYKEKGKTGLELTSPDQIEEISAAPVKPKAVVQKKVKPIELGGARQHLVDRHGVELSWAKEADEQAAFDYHAGLDHSNLGHVHVEAKPDEREQALAE